MTALFNNVRADKTERGGYKIQVELPCINGLSAWFTLAHVHEPDESATGYTDGILGCDAPRKIADAFVAALSPSRATEKGG